MKQIHSSQLHPAANKDVVITQPNSGETIVYDLKSNKAHCLNPTASFVWNQCDGHTSVSEIARRFSQERQAAVDESVIWLALKQLDHASLLEGRLAQEQFTDISRRTVLRKLGLAAAVSLPVVASLIAPEAVRAGSCIPLLNPCNGMGGQPCCPGSSCQPNPSGPGMRCQ
jgi:hypothetical protein